MKHLVKMRVRDLSSVLRKYNQSNMFSNLKIMIY